VHRTPFKNLIPPPPTLRLTERRIALLVVDFQVFAADRSAGLGRLAAERGLEEELEEYYEQVGCARRNVRDLVTAFRARHLPVLYSRRVAEPGTVPPWVPTADERARGGAVDCAVREAAERGRAVVLAADACAAETYALHDCVCTQLGGGAVRVRSTDAVLALLT